MMTISVLSSEYIVIYNAVYLPSLPSNKKPPVALSPFISFSLLWCIY